MQDYASKAKYVSAACRLTPDEELFVLAKMTDKASKTFAVVNRERIMNAAFDSVFRSNVGQVKGAVKGGGRSFTPLYPLYATAEPYDNEVLDFDTLTDVDKPTFKSVLQKLTIVKYTKPDPVFGQECMNFLLKVFSKDKNVGFFLIYELMCGSLPSTLIPDADKSIAMGSVLLHLLPDNYVTGLQRLILRVMETHPHLAAQMPAFKDERRLKLPTFAGLDVFQSHIKAVAAHLKQHKHELNLAKLRPVLPRLYTPPPVLVASPAVADAADYVEGRRWFRPFVRDYTCVARDVSLAHIPPTYLTLFGEYLQDSDLATLTSAPLMVSTVASAVRLLTAEEQKRYIGQKETVPLSSSVLQHPASRSHIARTSLTRLEQDMTDFYADASQTKVAHLTVLPLDTQRLHANLDVAQALTQLTGLQRTIEGLRDADMKFATQAMKQLVLFANGKHALFVQQDVAIAHILAQQSGAEMSLPFDFLAAAVASTDVSADLHRCNPFLAREEVTAITTATLLLMLVFSRISQANVVLTQLRSVLRTLTQLQQVSSTSTSSGNGAEEKMDGLVKELLAMSELLGATDRKSVV